MLDDILQGKGDIDGLSIAIASLFSHHYADKLNELLAFVRNKPKYFIILFLAILCTHRSVQTYISRDMEGNASAKLHSFLRIIRLKLGDVLQNKLTLDVFTENVYILWKIS